MDMSTTVAPKSSQLNADDLVTGPRTITITKVSGTGNGDQPVAMNFEGDNGKPYLPCKSMRRVMIEAWGVNALQYVGRSMTLFRDATVAFGGMQVGGIRISHMSDIPREINTAITLTKAKRAPYKVQPLRSARPAQEQSRPQADQPSAGAAPIVFYYPDGRTKAFTSILAWERFWMADDGVVKMAPLDDLGPILKANVASMDALAADHAQVVQRVRQAVEAEIADHSEAA